MRHTVLITTSGVGSRLGNLTQHTNKALVRIGNKPAISHIIESYPPKTRFVVTLGYFGNHVRDFLTLAYPNHDIKYVNVNPFEGQGSSLGYSMLSAKRLLQCPFIYHACDTLVYEQIPPPNKNWIGVIRGDDTSQYASWTLQEGKLHFDEKGAIDVDFIHIGLIGVHDYDTFWKTLKKLRDSDPKNSSLNDCQVLARMITKGAQADTLEFPSWQDIGNATALQQARERAGKSAEVLYKVGENIFIFEKFVIKFFSDTKIVSNRTTRGRSLKGFVPNIEGKIGNFFRYTFVPGEIYPDVVQPRDFEQFLKWAQKNFWKSPARPMDEKKFSKLCRSFYEKKTNARIDKFFSKNEIRDTKHTINGQPVPSLRDLLAKVDFKKLSIGLQSQFHGDLIMDNIIRTKDGFVLVDWREDFGGNLTIGDRYYDLAKLNHNLTINHSVINRNLFSVEVKGKKIKCDVMRPNTLVECQDVFEDFLEKNNYDINRVRLLTALIWLNMTPLHHHPFNLFLYYFGKLHLWQALTKRK